MAEEKFGQNRFIIWFSAVLIPLVGVGLYVYELFFKDSVKVTAPVAQTGSATPETQDAGKIVAMEKRLLEMQNEAENMCRNFDFAGAIILYERNQADFISFPEQANRLREELAGVYYHWAKMLKNREEYEDDARTIKDKLEKCLEIAPQGKYAEPARELLERLK
jgi:hypothetical protein